MKANQLEKLMQGCPFPVTWHHFKTEKCPPFVCWKELPGTSASSDFQTLKRVNLFRLELYYESWQQKARFEEFLMSLPLVWERIDSDVWISQEEMYLSIYEVRDDR